MPMSQHDKPPRDDRVPPKEAVSCDCHGRVTSIGDCGHVTTYVYDGSGNYVGEKPVDYPPPPPAPYGVTPHLTHTFEFRLSSSEAQELREPYERGGGRAILGITGVRAFLTRQGETTGPLSAIGGLEVNAEIDRKRVTCRAALSDFGSADLVVVQVDVAIYFC
jgi:YD repeat-containing protein